ncbi:MAG: PTS sugar transporter subunit IIA [Erysipelotrichia bacterium]|nr:PTS sugar transporter subunit IIA [Erysipelotrichia bacterium]
MLLNQFVEQKVTCYHQEFKTWQDAVKASGQPLVDQKYIDEQYIQAVIACVEKYGPYIVIAPNIAMPHSTEGAAGVYKTAIGFMKVEAPVVFDSNDHEKDARLFFMLAAANHEEHLKNMMELSEMLMNDELVEDLLKVKNDDDLLTVAKKYE